MTLAAVAFAAASSASCQAGAGTSASINVFAAASLTEAFTELGRDFEDDNPGTDVAFNFFSSGVLAQQIVDGAPADVFASADHETMQRVLAAGKAKSPRVIARNRLAIVVEPGNPKRVRTLADLARDDVVFVMCADAAPCGRLGAAALAGAGVDAAPSSLEDNVKAVVNRVALGEADAGLVYQTDVKAAGRGVDGVAIENVEDRAVESSYPMAVITGSTKRDAAEAWTAFVLSARGQRVLKSFGFRAP